MFKIETRERKLNWKIESQTSKDEQKLIRFLSLGCGVGKGK